MNENAVEILSCFLRDKTSNGLYPIVAYGLDFDNSNLTLLTTNIRDQPLAMSILKAATRREYNLGWSFPRQKLYAIANQNPHVFHSHDSIIPDLVREDQATVGKIVGMFGAPFYSQKGFALVDICSFSKLSHAEQLSQLYSLTNTLMSSSRRAAKFCARLGVRTAFGNTSTGDGFYLWHDMIGGNADVATFMVLLCIMTQAEAMRRDGFSMRLRATYVIDSAFMLYTPGEPIDLAAVATNAVGRATNGAARLINAAKPSQILVGEFSRKGMAGETMTPTTLIAQASELFREEGAGAGELAFDPDAQLRVSDKHGDAWYCWNLTGMVPNQSARQEIGLKPDDTRDLSKLVFCAEP